MANSVFSYQTVNSDGFQQSLKSAFAKPLVGVKSLEQFQAISSLKLQEKQLNATRFTFIRHGTSEGKTQNLAGGGLDKHELTEQGKREIEQIGKELKDQTSNCATIFTSPAVSARETAKILARILEVPTIKEDARLRQKHWGFYHGKPIDSEYKAGRVQGEKETDLLPTFWDKWNFKFDKENYGEESLLDVFLRMMDFLLETSRNPDLKGKNIYVITHTPLLKTLFASLVAFNEGQDLAYHRHDFGNGASVVVDIPENKAPCVVSVSGISFRGATKYQK